jgi:hypothetical protein
VLQGVVGLCHQPLHDLPGWNNVIHQPRALTCEGQKFMNPPLHWNGAVPATPLSAAMPLPPPKRHTAYIGNAARKLMTAGLQADR